MSTQKLNISHLRKHLKNFQFDKLFVECLGWEYPKRGQTSGKIQINGNSIPYLYIAEIGGASVLQFDQKVSNQFNSKSDKKKLHKEIEKQQCHKHIVLFSDEKNSFSLSYLSKEGQVRDHHSYFKGQNGDVFISKLASIHFGIEDEPKIAEIGEKLEKAFDTEKVTKKFFEDFKNNHFNFQKYISGIENEGEQKWFASLILNRLMFIWFLQKKHFVNDDVDYLQTKLTESKKRGKDRYYSEFLKLLFFEGFARKPRERSEQAKKLLGKIKYLNGGLFVPHPIEEKYENKIKIQDKAFDETFKIFNQYEWHLHDSKGKDNEISPDVMGYIFEKYINELQQKSLGAYYTRDEITKYLSRNTIQNYILDKVSQKGRQFESIAELLHKLDASLCKNLLADKDSILNTLTILDPSVGSGAFLVSAMKELIDIYSPIIGKIETLGDRELNQWLTGFKSEHKSILYGVKKNIILKNLYGVDIMKEATEVCKLRLFLSLVSSALSTDELEPLPNMDFNIMHGNSLIGFLQEEKHQESKNEKQLEWDAILGDSYQQLKEKYNKLVNQYKNRSLSFEKLKELKIKIENFLNENNFKLNRILANKCNQKGIKYSEIKEIHGKKKIVKRDILPENFYSRVDSRSLKPFHWDFAFNEIINRGGFDIIITNPPWEDVKNDDKEFFSEYNENIHKNKTESLEMKEIKNRLLKNSEIGRKYKKTEEFYLFQRNYFSKLYQYQSGKIITIDGKEKKASADMNTYRLFTERCFYLLVQGGFMGIVLPSRLCDGDGNIGLRRQLLFKKAKIEGLIDFQNQMSNGKGKIFEGVDSRFKFLLLNLKKDEPQDEFPCQFMERDLIVLNEHNFPKNPSMKQSITEIKSFSPRDCSIIEFKNSVDREIFKKTKKIPQLEEQVKKSWNPDFYRELETTRLPVIQENKPLPKDHLSLYQGKAIWQYTFNFNLSEIKNYLSIYSNTAQRDKLCFKYKCYKNYRLVIRRQASNTNERSLISTVIPKNYFIADNLHGVLIENNYYMFCIQAFLNSFVVDYLLRVKNSDSNITKNDLMSLRIPRLAEKDPYFKELVERSAKLTCIGTEFDELADEIDIKRGGITDQQERWKIQGEIDAMVAYVYDLDEDEFKYILDTFTTGKNQERLETLKKYALEAFKKDQFLKESA